MLYYVEVHESRRFTAVLEARSEEHARARAAELHRDGELPGDVLNTELIAIAEREEKAA